MSDDRVQVDEHLPAKQVVHLLLTRAGLRGQPARRVPRPLLRLLGLGGDAVSKVIGKPFLINSSRVRSMTSDYLVPGAIEHTLAVLGPPRHTLEEGVQLTLDWLKSKNASELDR